MSIVIFADKGIIADKAFEKRQKSKLLIFTHKLHILPFPIYTAAV